MLVTTWVVATDVIVTAWVFATDVVVTVWVFANDVIPKTFKSCALLVVHSFLLAFYEYLFTDILRRDVASLAVFFLTLSTAGSISNRQSSAVVILISKTVNT